MSNLWKGLCILFSIFNLTNSIPISKSTPEPVPKSLILKEIMDTLGYLTNECNNKNHTFCTTFIPAIITDKTVSDDEINCRIKKSISNVTGLGKLAYQINGLFLDNVECEANFDEKHRVISVLNEIGTVFRKQYKNIKH